MKRFRLSTLMLLVVIAALGIALVVQQRRAARREAELQAGIRNREEIMTYYIRRWRKLSELVAENWRDEWFKRLGD
jgi:hypothetical protein